MIMTPEPNTIEAFRLTIAKQQESNRTLQSRITTLEQENADMESVIRKFKKKYGPLNPPDNPPITPVRFVR
jgi:septal ring factor EnvC (AmiA/AmiB activator)